MCGIIHVKRKKGIPANKAVIKRYKKQKARGTEGFGFIEIKNGKAVSIKRSEDEKTILEALEKSTADEILFHHRTPTSTPNFIESTHPIIVKHDDLKYDYYVVHNGIIYNDAKMKADHIKENFTYTTLIEQSWKTTGKEYVAEVFNDSEAMAIDLVLSLERSTLMQSRGSIAFIALRVDKKTKKAVTLFYGRNSGNPLGIELQSEFMAISSESGKELKINTLYAYDYATGKTEEAFKSIGVVEYTGYSSHGYPPDYGHYDEDAGMWRDTGELDDDYDDDTFTYEWDEMLEELSQKVKRARQEENWDLVDELEMELDTMECHFLELKAEAERDKRREKAGKKLGF